MADIAILGTGSFGLSLGILLYNNKHNVIMYSPFHEEVELLKKDREYKKLLPGVKIPKGIAFTTEVDLVKDKDMVLFAVPSFAVRQTAKKIAPFIRKGTIIADVAKGIEGETFYTLSQVIEDEIKDCPVVALSGPSHAEEVSRQVPTAIVAASKDQKAAEKVQEFFASSVMRVYTNQDVLGVELGGALKNIIALCIGVLDGMKLGDNSKAAVMTRGMKEITRLGVAMGANAETFMGLTGIGDLIVTATSMHSRNRRAGILIGQGVDPKEAVEQVGTVEGYTATKVAYEIAKKLSVDMPITNLLYAILYQALPISEATALLMNRPKKNESEFDWMNEQ